MNENDDTLHIGGSQTVPVLVERRVVDEGCIFFVRVLDVPVSDLSTRYRSESVVDAVRSVNSFSHELLGNDSRDVAGHSQQGTKCSSE